MKDQISFFGMEQHLSSAKQVSDVANRLQRQIAEKAINRMGAEAQIKSAKILIDHREELEVMKKSTNTILAHHLEQAKQQVKEAQERNRIETERYRENLKFTKIAAWTGIIGLTTGAISVVLQFIL